MSRSQLKSFLKLNESSGDNYPHVLGEAFFTRSQLYDHLTGSILDMIPHVTEVIAEQTSVPGITVNDIKWTNVDSYKNDNGRYLVVMGILTVGDDAIKVHGKLPMDVVLECDKSKIREYFESKRKLYQFEKAAPTQETTLH